MSRECAAIIVAAGSSRRMGFDKLTAPLAGRPLVLHGVAAFQQCSAIADIVCVCAAERVEEFRALVSGFSKVRAIVPGGRERVESVLAGVEALGEPGPRFVAVHDGARPLISPAAIAACCAAAREFGAAVSAEPVTDTLHRADRDGLTFETVSRDNLWRMQTPQIMETSVLESLLRRSLDAGAAVTDEISLLIRSGHIAKVVDHPDWNFKVTYPRDLVLAEMVLRARMGSSGAG